MELTHKNTIKFRKAHRLSVKGVKPSCVSVADKRLKITKFIFFIEVCGKISIFARYVQKQKIHIQSEDTFLRGEETVQVGACAEIHIDADGESGHGGSVFLALHFSAWSGTSQDRPAEEGECEVELEDGGDEPSVRQVRRVSRSVADEG